MHNDQSLELIQAGSRSHQGQMSEIVFINIFLPLRCILRVVAAYRSITVYNNNAPFSVSMPWALISAEFIIVFEHCFYFYFVSIYLSYTEF